MSAFPDPDEQLELLTLSSDEFAQGVARLIEFVMENRHRPVKQIIQGGAPTSEGAVAPADLYESITYE